MIAALTGLVVGIQHVWSGPDHLAAIAPLAVRRQTRAWMPGLRWGIGHSAGVAAIGLLFLWLRELLPVKLLSAWGDLLSTWGERLVGIMLLAIGAWALRKAFRIHVHEHEHEGQRHIHLHAHSPRVAHEQAQAHHRHTHAAFGIGLLHGLAGSSHFFGVLLMLAFPTRLQSLTYLAAFSLGTIVSMAAFSWFMGLLASRWSGSNPKIYRGMLGLCGASAMLVGCFWLAH